MQESCYCMREDDMDIMALLDELDTFDAPTVCNGLELIDNSYRLKGYGRQE